MNLLLKHPCFWSSYLLTLAILSSCGRDPENHGSVASAEKPKEVLPREVAEPEATPNFQEASVWATVGGSESWTASTLNVIRSRRADLEKARDLEAFCPNYSTADTEHRELCWLRLVGALVQQESSFNPKAVFIEPFGSSSIGLMMLSPGECANAATEELLKIATRNLECGVGKMADLIQRDSYIDGPDGQRGAGAYWSVLRAPYQSDGYDLGKKAVIQKATKQYLQF
jgi:hypothetical protein